MRCCSIFLDFLLVLTMTLTRFSLIPVMGDIAVEMSQGHRICVRVFCLKYSYKLDFFLKNVFCNIFNFKFDRFAKNGSIYHHSSYGKFLEAVNSQDPLCWIQCTSQVARRKPFYACEACGPVNTTSLSTSLVAHQL